MDVQAWFAHLDDVSVDEACCYRLLSSEEQNRAGRFAFCDDRRRYIVSHAALRSVLASHLLVLPEELQFSIGLNGKPSLTAMPGHPRIEFNLSHSQGMAAIAVARERRIGVDVEWVRHDFPFADVARQFFSAEEIVGLIALPTRLQRLAFYQCWTAKEALAKATGTGLDGQLNLTEIVRTRGDIVRIKSTMPGWNLSELQPGRGYVGAMAIEGEECEVRCFRWQSFPRLVQQARASRSPRRPPRPNGSGARSKAT